MTDFNSKIEFLVNWFKRLVMVVLPVNSTAGVYLNLIATFSPSIGMKRGVEVGEVEVGRSNVDINAVEVGGVVLRRADSRSLVKGATGAERSGG